MGSMHRYHPDDNRGDPVDAVLYDGCDRCHEHAATLYDLSAHNLLRIRVEQPLTAVQAMARENLGLYRRILERSGMVVRDAVTT